MSRHGPLLAQPPTTTRSLPPWMRPTATPNTYILSYLIQYYPSPEAGSSRLHPGRRRRRDRRLCPSSWRGGSNMQSGHLLSTQQPLITHLCAVAELTTRWLLRGLRAGPDDLPAQDPHDDEFLLAEEEEGDEQDGGQDHQPEARARSPFEGRRYVLEAPANHRCSSRRLVCDPLPRVAGG